MKNLEEMMSKNTLLINNIKRSELAYCNYKLHPNYHHALRIYYANKKIYKQLNRLLEVDSLDEKYLIDIFNYLFHLEDWFFQFNLLENKTIQPQDEFIFEPFIYSISYPKNFMELLLK